MNLDTYNRIVIKVLLKLDYLLFKDINSLPHPSYSDTLFSFFSGIGRWGLVWIVLGIILLVKERIENKKHIVPLFIAIIFSILMSEFVIKNLVQRERPLISDTFSFPSSHATVSFAAAFVLSRYHKRWNWVFYVLAILISFSRIYLGQHYPGDVLAGMFLGVLIGYISIKASHKLI